MSNTKSFLQRHAAFIQSIRDFFVERNVTEVDTPLVRNAPVTDPYLNALKTIVNGEVGYLQTSPEYGMKILLSEGSGDIYQICKAFRQDEVGRLHKPEFTMLEWYRLGFNDDDLMQEISALCQHVLNCEPADKHSYREIFEKYLGFDPHRHYEEAVGAGLCPRPFFSDAKLLPNLRVLVEQHCGDIQGLDEIDDTTALQLLFSEVIEPRLGQDRPVLIYDYPSDQAALARLKTDAQGIEVAARFELYYKGIELANGYWELTNAQAQRQRFEADLVKRQAQKISPVPIDEDLMAALEKGLPDCAGVALGVDRLFMLAMAKTKI